MTKEDIVNLALYLMGAESISAMTDSSKQALIANQVYNQCLKECYEIPEDWYFAIAREQLSRLSDAPAFGTYQYQYAKPDNCIRIVATIDEGLDTIEYQYEEEVFKAIGSDGTVTLTDVMLCNQEEVFVKYIIFRDDPSLYPAWFCKLIAAKIAIYLAAPLRGGADNYTSFQIEKLWNAAFSEAKIGNASHQKIIEGTRNSESGVHDLTNAPNEGLSAI